MTTLKRECRIRWLGRQSYEPLWRAMQGFTAGRVEQTVDEVWFCEHPPVFTLGLAADRSHVLAPGDIPLVGIDRGGQVTYHGPGQLMIYPLLNVKRRKLGVRALVMGLEQAVVNYVAQSEVIAAGRRDAPGVYVDGAKLASIGLRIRRGCSYHGMALNVDMDTEPFNRINPCGMENLPITTLTELGLSQSLEEAAIGLCDHLADTLDLEYVNRPDAAIR
ncbi:MAG: lipoyl(octanoyl) transferase LipB [Pseudomonadota bacterium]